MCSKADKSGNTESRPLGLYRFQKQQQSFEKKQNTWVFFGNNLMFVLEYEMFQKPAECAIT